jgi:hypothetical protein
MRTERRKYAGREAARGSTVRCRSFLSFLRSPSFSAMALDWRGITRKPSLALNFLQISSFLTTATGHGGSQEHHEKISA